MKHLMYLFIAVFMVSCGSGNSNKYEKTIEHYVTKGKSNELRFKVVEIAEQVTVTVADSIAYLTDEFKKDQQLIINRIELALKTTKELQAKQTTKHNHEKYITDIAVMNARIDSLKNLTPDNLNGYDSKNPSDILAVIVRCKYSIELPGTKPVEETFDFYMSPDGTKCYGKKRAK